MSFLADIDLHAQNLKKTQTKVRDQAGNVHFEERSDEGIKQSCKGDKEDILIEAAKDPELFEVLPQKLYIGSQDAASNLDGLNNAKITGVLNVAFGENHFVEKFVYKNVQILDTEQVRHEFGACFF